MEPVAAELLKHTKRMVSTDAELLMREHYETLYGVYDHRLEDPNHPLALIMMQSGEDNMSASVLSERIKLFKYLDIHKHFGVSFPEFMELPTYIVDEILKVCADEKRQSNAAEQHAIDGLKNAGV